MINIFVTVPITTKLMKKNICKKFMWGVFWVLISADVQPEQEEIMTCTVRYCDWGLQSSISLIQSMLMPRDFCDMLFLSPSISSNPPPNMSQNPKRKCPLRSFRSSILLKGKILSAVFSILFITIININNYNITLNLNHHNVSSACIPSPVTVCFRLNKHKATGLSLLVGCSDVTVSCCTKLFFCFFIFLFGEVVYSLSVPQQSVSLLPQNCF